MSVLERSLHFGPGTSVTSPLRWKGSKSGFRVFLLLLTVFLLLLTLDTCPQSRPWECGNPKGISKECGKGGKPASWLSILSIFCHFHGLLWNACSKSEVTENHSLGNAVSMRSTGPEPASARRSFRFSLFRSQHPHRVGTHRANCRNIHGNQ
jgi:hypothetical protein